MSINGIDVTSIVRTVLEVIIGAACVFITTKVVPWLKAKLKANQIENIKSIVKSGVDAAEQLYDSGEGQQKLEYATEQINKALEGAKITISPDLLRTYIEAAVLELKKI